MGVAGIATTGLASCVGAKKDAKDSPEGEVPKDKMTYRTNHTTGDKVSILGFGMMRLPTKEVAVKNEGDEVNEEIDQEEVNRLRCIRRDSARSGGSYPRERDVMEPAPAFSVPCKFTKDFG